MTAAPSCGHLMSSGLPQHIVDISLSVGLGSRYQSLGGSR